MTINKLHIKKFQQQILSFYSESGRDLPWRKTTNKYRILVSEIMLQQTQVSRVLEKYAQWLKTFPTLQSLADAELKEVLKAWSGLGYNSRGKRLWEAAKICVEKYDGELPATPKELLTLPGIGPYTSRSILIFSENKKIATVDTNIRRILIHEFDLDKKISDKELYSIAEKILPQGKSKDWHNALMDYGQIVNARRTGIKPKTKQSKFKGSRREYRARIIKHLTNNDSLTQAQAEELCKESPYNITKILQELEAEGMIQKKGMTYFI